MCWRITNKYCKMFKKSLKNVPFFRKSFPRKAPSDKRLTVEWIFSSSLSHRSNTFYKRTKVNPIKMLLKVLKWGKHTSSKFLANLVVPVIIFCEQIELRIEYCLPVYIRIRRLFTSLRSFSGIETASQVHFWLIGSMEPSLKPPGMHPPTLKPSNKTWSCQTTPGLYSYIFKIILKTWSCQPPPVVCSCSIFNTCNFIK